jgi:hypothetical protein
MDSLLPDVNGSLLGIELFLIPLGKDSPDGCPLVGGREAMVLKASPLAPIGLLRY